MYKVKFLDGTVVAVATLRAAPLRAADLRGEDLRGQDLRGADLSYSSLYGAKLNGASLNGAVLRHADLSYVSLHKADLRGADLRHAILSDADVGDAILDGAQGLGGFVVAAQGELIVYKGLRDSVIATLRIPAHAQRVNKLGSRKCRASEAVVLELSGGAQCGASTHDPRFVYEVGAAVRPTKPFDADIRRECASGIHFFLTREEAEDYTLEILTWPSKSLKTRLKTSA